MTALDPARARLGGDDVCCTPKAGAVNPIARSARIRHRRRKRWGHLPGRSDAPVVTVASIGFDVGQVIELAASTAAAAATTTTTTTTTAFSPAAGNFAWASAAKSASQVVVVTATTALKLSAICAVVAAIRSKLPPETPRCLSAVAYNLLIPSFLFTRVALAVSELPFWDFVVLPLLASFQIMLGLFLGWITTAVVYGDIHLSWRWPFVHRRSSPAPSARELRIAGSVAEAAGLDPSKAASVLVTASSKSEAKPPLFDISGASRRISIACSAFGNTLTLPIIFLATLLPKEAMGNASAYIALFLIGWTPWLWTLGFSILSGPQRDDQAGGGGNRIIKAASRIANPPLIGIFCGALYGLSPLKAMVASGAGQQSQGLMSVFVWLASSLIGSMELLASGTVAVQMLVLSASLARIGQPQIQTLKLVETRTLWVVAFVRYLVLPLLLLIMVMTAASLGWAPSDPTFIAVLLVQGAMPPAQNLVLLANLRDKADAMPTALAAALFRLYLFALVPLSIWIVIILLAPTVSIGQGNVVSLYSSLYGRP